MISVTEVPTEPNANFFARLLGKHTVQTFLYILYNYGITYAFGHGSSSD
jgi:hypothetical protein